MKAILEDDSLMPFGKHKGKMMQDVPASYLHWLWHEASLKNQVKTSNVADYISRNIVVLKTENPDLIWS